MSSAIQIILARVQTQKDLDDANGVPKKGRKMRVSAAELKIVQRKIWGTRLMGYNLYV
jgi:hypothetical protein